MFFKPKLWNKSDNALELVALDLPDLPEFPDGVDETWSIDSSVAILQLRLLTWNGRICPLFLFGPILSSSNFSKTYVGK